MLLQLRLHQSLSLERPRLEIGRLPDLDRQRDLQEGDRHTHLAVLGQSPVGRERPLLHCCDRDLVRAVAPPLCSPPEMLQPCLPLREGRLMMQTDLEPEGVCQG